MLIAIDYDDTYTRDPEFWNIVINEATSRGHAVICVTMRAAIYVEAEEVIAALGHIVHRIIFTNRAAKLPFVTNLGYNVSVWIDDNPNWIIKDANY